MDNKFYVSYEAARLLKEKGYNEECDCAIDEDSDIYVCEYRMNQDLPEWKWSCPTKSEAIDWLESKGMCIVVIRRTIDNEVGWRYVIYNQTEIISGFSTRLEAEEAAIIKACKLLENGN
jgi:hypothetical protein